MRLRRLEGALSGWCNATVPNTSRGDSERGTANHQGFSCGFRKFWHAAAHGAGLYGLAPLLEAAHIGSKMQGLPDQVGSGRVLRKLRVNPEALQTKAPVEGPQTFNYPNHDDIYGGPKPSSSPSPSNPKAAKAEATMKAKGKLGKNEPSQEVAGGGVVDNVFGEKTIYSSVVDWVKSHGYEVRPTADRKANEVGIPWTNKAKGTEGVSWERFTDLKSARDLLGY